MRATMAATSSMSGSVRSRAGLGPGGEAWSLGTTLYSSFVVENGERRQPGGGQALCLLAGVLVDVRTSVEDGLRNRRQSRRALVTTGHGCGETPMWIFAAR